jgi:hypothetical protein
MSHNAKQKMTDKICKYFQPNSVIFTCDEDEDEELIDTCPECGINTCDSVAHIYHYCLGKKSCCYLCGGKSESMVPCHNSEYLQDKQCFAYYCPDCAGTAAIRTAFSKFHMKFLIVECVNCPETLEQRSLRKDKGY